MKVRATRWILALGAFGCSTSADQTGTDTLSASVSSPAGSDSNTEASSLSGTGTSGDSASASSPTASGPVDPTTGPAGTSTDTTDTTTNATTDTTTGGEPPPATCEGAGGKPIADEPVLSFTLADRWEEAWLGSAAVVDLDGDGTREIVVPRANALIAWNLAGDVLFKTVADGGRIWSSPVIADFRGGPELEIAFAARDQVYMLDHTGAVLSGFPVAWDDEMRALAAGDVDGDGELDLVASVGRSGPDDVVNAWHADGTVVAGFPPNQAGVSGCDGDDKCYLAGCYDQNLAVADLDADGRADIVAPHDNAYASIHSGTGVAFDAADIYPALKTPGVRYLHALADAMQGYADEEETALQAHFTNTAPAIADIDDDGTLEVILLASVQNAAQSNREQGVAVWVVGHDASRRPGFDPPVHLPDYLSGLWDYGNNIVGITNQASVADLRADVPGREIVFVGFDGRVHAVSASGQVLWSTQYTTDPEVAAAGVAIADLSGDGSPEVVFNTYSTGDDKGHLFILGSDGAIQHQLPLPRRGAMPVPTLADVDGDGTVEIVVSLKDAEDKVESVRVYTVPDSSATCLLWPTGRANLLRNGLAP